MKSNVLIMKILFVGPLPFIHRPINVLLVEMIRPQPRKKPFKIVLEQVSEECPKNIGLVPSKYWLVLEEVKLLLVWLVSE